MLNGNFFLKGWYLPQDNFFFEDNLFDLIALRVFGFKMYILSVVPALIYSLTVFTFIYFIFYKLKEKNIFNLFALFTGLILIALPQSFLYLFFVSSTGYHIVTTFYLLLIIIFIDKYLNPLLPQIKSKSFVLLISIIFFESISTISDPLALYLGIIPVLLWSVVSFFKNYDGKPLKQINKKLIILILITIFSIIIRTSFLYFLSKYAILVKPHIAFATYAQLLNNIKLFIEGLLTLFGANFFGLSLYKFSTFFTLVRLCIFLFVFYYVISVLKNFFKTKKYNINHLISIICIFALSAYLFSNQPDNLFSTRYLIPYFIFSLIIFITELNIKNIKKINFLKSKWLVYVVFLLIFFIYVYSTLKLVKSAKPNQTYYQLASFLNKNNLKYGYGSYWDSSVITVATEDKIKIRAVVWNGHEILPFNWLSNKVWYRNFIKLSRPFFILFGKSNWGNINYANCINSFGKPSKVIKFQRFTILKYNNPKEEAEKYKTKIFSKLYHSANYFLTNKNNISNLYPKYLELHGYLPKIYGFEPGSANNWTKNGGWIGKWSCPEGRGSCFGVGISGDINTLMPIIKKYNSQSLQIFFPFPKLYNKNIRKGYGQLLIIFKRKIVNVKNNG